MQQPDIIELSAFLRELGNSLIKRAMTVSKIDQSEVEAWMVLIYEKLGYPKPEFLWVNNPWQLHFAANRLAQPLTPFYLLEDNKGVLQRRQGDYVLPGNLLSITKLENSIGKAARSKLEEFLDQDFSEFFRRLWEILPRRELPELAQVVDAERRSRIGSMRVTSEQLFRSETIRQLRSGNLGADLAVLYSTTRFSPIEWSANALLTLAIHEATRNYYKLPLEPGLNDVLDCLLGLAKASHAYVCYENLCILSQRPTCVRLDENNRFHDESEPAICYEDHLDIYAWHGVRVPPEAILTEASLDAIMGAENVEVRRVLIDRYGAQNYILDSGSLIVHHDECGTLYRKDLGYDEPILMVRVTNSTAEPDGEFRTYFLRVPPTMQTAREAVAWTFGLSENEYFPLQET